MPVTRSQMQKLPVSSYTRSQTKAQEGIDAMPPSPRTPAVQTPRKSAAIKRKPSMKIEILAPAPGTNTASTPHSPSVRKPRTPAGINRKGSLKPKSKAQSKATELDLKLGDANAVAGTGVEGGAMDTGTKHGAKDFGKPEAKTDMKLVLQYGGKPFAETVTSSGGILEALMSPAMKTNVKWMTLDTADQPMTGLDE